MYATIRRTSILELLGPLGIMGIQSRAPLKHHRQYGAEGLKKALNWAPIMLRQASFLNGWRWNFQHLLETRNDRREKRTTNILWCREKSCVFFPSQKSFIFHLPGIKLSCRFLFIFRSPSPLNPLLLMGERVKCYVNNIISDCLVWARILKTTTTLWQNG